MAEYIIKHINITSAVIRSVEGAIEVSYSGKLTADAIRRFYAKEVGHKNFFVDPSSITVTSATYRMDAETFRGMAKPRDRFNQYARLVTLRETVTDITYFTPDTTDENGDTITVEGKLTDAQQRKAVASHVGHKNFYISVVRAHESELCVKLADFIQFGELVA